MRPLKKSIGELKLPKISELYYSNEYNETYNWNKKGGHSGEKTIEKVKLKLKELGWNLVKDDYKDINGKISHEIKYESLDNIISIKLYTYIGNESSDNSYRISASLILENTDVLQKVSEKLKGKVLFPKRVEELRGKIIVKK